MKSISFSFGLLAIAILPVVFGQLNPQAGAYNGLYARDVDGFDDVFTRDVDTSSG